MPTRAPKFTLLRFPPQDSRLLYISNTTKGTSLAGMTDNMRALQSVQQYFHNTVQRIEKKNKKQQVEPKVLTNWKFARQPTYSNFNQVWHMGWPPGRIITLCT